MSSRPVLRLVPFYCGTLSEGLELLGRDLAILFHVDIERHPPAFDPETAYDPSRGQYDSRKLLTALLRHHADDCRVLGVTDVDLFIPILTFVFGEAQLLGRVALLSGRRLDDQRYGLPANPRRLADRLLKEAVHELGHTYGLVHCLDRRCVMSSSPVVEAVDAKSSRFCQTCAARQAEAASAPLPARHPAPSADDPSL